MRQRNRRHADANVRLLEVAFFFETDGRLRLRRAAAVGRPRGLQSAELALHQFHNLIVRHVASRSDHQMVRREPILKTRANCVAIEFFHRLRRAKDRPPERMPGPEAARKNLVKQIFGIVQIHLDFFEDHLALFLHVLGIKFRAQNEVGDHVEGDGEIRVEHLGVEADLFFRGECVEHAADGIHFASNGFGGAALRALEDHVFDEVGKAVFLGDFAAGTVAHPDPHRDGSDVRHSLGNGHQAIRQDLLLDVANLARHLRIVTQVAQKGKRERPLSLSSMPPRT